MAVTSTSTPTATWPRPQALVDEIVPSGGQAEAVAFDVTDADASRAALEALLADSADPDPGQQRRHPRRRRLPRHARRRSGTA